MCSRDAFSSPQPLHYQNPTTYSQSQLQRPSARRPSLSYLLPHQHQHPFPPPPLLPGNVTNSAYPSSHYHQPQLLLASGQYEYALSSDRTNKLGMRFDSKDAAPGGTYEDEGAGEEQWRAGADESYSDFGRREGGVEWQGCDPSTERSRQGDGGGRDEFVGDGQSRGAGGSWNETTCSLSHQLVEDTYDHPSQHQHQHQHSSSLPLDYSGASFEYSSNPPSFSASSSSSNGPFPSSTPIPFKQTSSSFAPYSIPSLPPRSFSYDDYGPSFSSSYIQRPHPPRSTTVPAIKFFPQQPILSTSLLPPPPPTSHERPSHSHHHHHHRRQTSYDDDPHLHHQPANNHHAPLLSPSSNSTFSSQSSVTTNSTVFSTPNSSYAKMAALTNGSIPPQSPTLYQQPVAGGQEGLVGYSPRGERSDGAAADHAHQQGLLLSFESNNEEEGFHHTAAARDEFFHHLEAFEFDQDQDMRGVLGSCDEEEEGEGGLGLVEMNNTVVDAETDGGGGSSSSSKRKADDQEVEEGEGEEKQREEKRGEPVVILTKAGKPRKKKGKAIVACEECRRLKMRCDNKVPCSSCIGRGCPSICPHGTLANLKGKRLVLSDTVSLHARITALETALAISYAREHPSWSASASSSSGGNKKSKSSSATAVERTHPLLTKDALVAETDSKAK